MAQVKWGPISEGRWERLCLQSKDGFCLDVIPSVFVENTSSERMEVLVRDHTAG